MESRVGVTCALLLLACIQINAQWFGGPALGAGPGGARGFSPMAAFMGFQSCQPFASPPRRTPQSGGARRPGQGPPGVGQAPRRPAQQRSMAPNLSSFMWGQMMDPADAPDINAMPIPGPNGQMQWHGCFCQSPDFGFGSGECSSLFTGHYDECMQYGLCCTCDYGFKR